MKVLYYGLTTGRGMISFYQLSSLCCSMLNDVLQPSKPLAKNTQAYGLIQRVPASITFVPSSSSSPHSLRTSSLG